MLQSTKTQIELQLLVASPKQIVGNDLILLVVYLQPTKHIRINQKIRNYSIQSFKKQITNSKTTITTTIIKKKREAKDKK